MSCLLGTLTSFFKCLQINNYAHPCWYYFHENRNHRNSNNNYGDYATRDNNISLTSYESNEHHQDQHKNSNNQQLSITNNSNNNNSSNNNSNNNNNNHYYDHYHDPTNWYIDGRKRRMKKKEVIKKLEKLSHVTKKLLEDYEEGDDGQKECILKKNDNIHSIDTNNNKDINNNEHSVLNKNVDINNNNNNGNKNNNNNNIEKNKHKNDDKHTNIDFKIKNKNTENNTKNIKKNTIIKNKKNNIKINNKNNKSKSFMKYHRVDTCDKKEEEEDEDGVKMGGVVDGNNKKMSAHRIKNPSLYDNECLVCYTREACVRTLPCAHEVLCMRCFLKTIQSCIEQGLATLYCAVCRRQVIDIHHPNTPLPLRPKFNQTPKCSYRKKFY